MNRTRLTRAILPLTALLAAVAFLPLRIVLGLIELDRYGFAARSIEGTVWRGRIHDLTIANIPVGTLDAALAPERLLLGRVRVRILSQGSDGRLLVGALESGWRRTGVDDVNGVLPLGQRLAPLPVGALALKGVTVRLHNRACVSAQGHVRAEFTMPLPGLDFAQGLAGEIRCDGSDLLVPLATQSGRGRMNLRIMPSGRYRLDLAIAATDPQLDGVLAPLGFRRAGELMGMTVGGSL